jgi:Arc/MetJ-type ribon-helix-helix transcriptional regulator
MKNRTTIQLSENLRKELKILSSKRDISYQELLKDMISVFKELDKEKTIISIPKKLANKIKENIKNTDIKSVSEYIVFILRLVLSEDKTKISKRDEEKIKQKLKNLGYLD